MGVRIMEGAKPWDGAVLYCSTSMWAFGPVFENSVKAAAFLKWLRVDPRCLEDRKLEAKYGEFLVYERERHDE